MEPALQEKLLTLPQGPGVYLMRDREGRVIYVGKAVNLRARVRSYFNRTGDSRAFVALLDRLLGDVETVGVRTEKEALLLENELIKKHKPRFNVQLRDDKNFICLRLDVRAPYPRLEVVRRFHNDGARYFGPYSSATAIRDTLRTVNRYFQLRTCSDHVLHNRKRPCLLHQIGRCPGPCVLEVPEATYRRSVEEVLLFLGGRGTDLVESLRARMKDAASALRFEEAARVRDQLRAIERSLERQAVASDARVDLDVFGLTREGDRLAFYVLYVRQGRALGGRAVVLSGQEFPDEELLASFVNLYYAEGNLVPDQVMLPVSLEAQEALAEVLTELKGSRVRVHVPQRGARRELLAMAVQNAEAALRERKRDRDEALAILERLKDRLALQRVPRRIECFDVSHFQGACLVASLAAATDGEPDRARYRRFKIRTVAGQDDFASMYEVLSRRLKRGLAEQDLPDLIVIDGGKGQLASAHAALRDLGVLGVDLVSLAKSRELEAPREGGAATGGRAEAAVRSPERVFLVGRKDPVVLAQNSAELFVLVRVRDEAHRFAITYQQRSMRRQNLRSVLEDVPGVGAGRTRALLRHFGSLKRVREASIEQLAEAPGLGPAVAERIHGFLHGRAEDEDAVREASLEDASAGQKAQEGSPDGER